MIFYLLQEIKQETKTPEGKKQNEEYNANTNISTINVSKEQKDLLLLENAGLKKDNELYKTKLLSIDISYKFCQIFII